MSRPSRIQVAVLEKLTREGGRIDTRHRSPVVMWNDVDASRHATVNVRTLNALFVRGWVKRGEFDSRTVYITDEGREALERSRA